MRPAAQTCWCGWRSQHNARRPFASPPANCPAEPPPLPHCGPFWGGKMCQTAHLGAFGAPLFPDPEKYKSFGNAIAAPEPLQNSDPEGPTPNPTALYMVPATCGSNPRHCYSNINPIDVGIDRVMLNPCRRADIKRPMYRGNFHAGLSTFRVNYTVRPTSHYLRHLILMRRD